MFNAYKTWYLDRGAGALTGYPSVLVGALSVGSEVSLSAVYFYTEATGWRAKSGLAFKSLIHSPELIQQQLDLGGI